MGRTLVVTNDFPPRIGGIESFVADLCHLLDDDVVVLASGPPGAAATDTARGYPVLRRGGLLLPTPAVARDAARLLRSTGADRVLFGAAAPLGLLAPALRRAGARHVVGLTHGHEVWWARVPAARAVLRRVGDGCDHLTTISDHTTAAVAAALSPAARRRLLRLPPPVDLDRFTPAPDDALGARPVRCVAVGRFVRQKGFDTLLRAWRTVLDGWPAAAAAPELVLVGDGPERAALTRLAGALGLAPTVRMTGALDRDAVLAELRAARVFALPVRSRWGGLYAEGLGLAAVEAAACGLPVVVGRSGGAPETVVDGRTGAVVEPDDPAAVAGAVRTLLLDPARAAALGAAGRRHVAARYGADAARRTLRAALELG
ncbi:phosphatidylinositol alpha-1,6-mannosyltransferase [Friedmanniella luteola]|uniref:Phosphatidylinositol alpha-1,6-mannosyltransferase n=1 Tax=Friedmanniella luteola TaxID=546871 RepID=A0A1H1P5L2_9ACTN|nr:glycosyltransferase family 4 protein [Friedmanniella luteola]SDS06578.1 phosphatidylinositol alpha-1,6-mannosyltransferase [Friedmanniella luteola]